MIQQFYEAFLRYAVDWVFWAVSIGVAISAWWIFSVASSRLYYGSNPNQPMEAARAAINTGSALAVIGIGLSTWIGWHDVNRVISGSAMALIAVAIVTTVIFSLDREE